MRADPRAGLLVLSQLLLFNDSVEAQDAFHYGVHLGMGGSFVSFPDEVKTLEFEPPLQGEVVLKEGLRPVLRVGVFALFPIGAGFSMEQDISVNMRGGTLKGDEALKVDGYPGVTVGVEAKESYRLTSVDLAILARYTQDKGTRTAYLGVGPEIGYVFHSKFAWDYKVGVGGFAPEDLTGSEDLKEIVQEANLGLLFLFGVGFPQKAYSIFIEGCFGLGLTDVFESFAGVDTPQIRNRGFTINLGLMR